VSFYALFYLLVSWNSYLYFLHCSFYTLKKSPVFRVLVLWTAILIILVLLVAHYTRFSFRFLLILVVQLNP
jgi:hypothetical protein